LSSTTQIIPYLYLLALTSPLFLGFLEGDPQEDLLQLAAVEGPEGGGREDQLIHLLSAFYFSNNSPPLALCFNIPSLPGCMVGDPLEDPSILLLLRVLRAVVGKCQLIHLLSAFYFSYNPCL
jgi:hypothetical protein